LVTEEFQDTDELDGIFSASGTWRLTPGSSIDNPRSVFQVVRRHFSRYTPEMVEQVAGVPPALFEEVAQKICANSGRERTTAFCYAVGWTQHTTGAQFIRTAAILQLLLGNIGRPGGGILALRGHASIQGSTDIPTLYHLLPGYIPMPAAGIDLDFETWFKRHTNPSSGWRDFRKYAVSLLKAWFGDAARAENGWCFDRLPLLTGDHSHMTTVADMADGKVRGYFVMGENPVIGSVHGQLQRVGLKKLDWLVVRDLTLTETAEFWRESPESIETEVFFFPASAHTEKAGSFTNTQRLLQWHFGAVEPPGDCHSELDFVYELGRRLHDLTPELTWDYSGPEEVLREISGFGIDGFHLLKDDGSTRCGCWIYAGATAGGINRTARREPQKWIAPEWGWAWPANRRMLYNRASADREGRPWSERKKYISWNDEIKSWEGPDVPDVAGGVKSPAFLMLRDGVGALFVEHGLKDGPLPTHYEPRESVVRNPLYKQQTSPSHMEWRRADNPYHQPFDDPRFPYVITTYRLTEHHTAGGMSRTLPWLAELQPEMFCEVSPELARERGLKHGEWAAIRTARGAIEARVLITRRLKPLRVGGRIVHQIAVPFHWSGKSTANELIALVADPNVSIQESKALTGDIRGMGT
jgi:formate dehydrogenase major subunit